MINRSALALAVNKMYLLKTLLTLGTINLTKRFYMKSKLLSLSLSLTFISFSATATGPGVSTAHKQLRGVTTGASSEHQKYAPKLHVEHGCQPFAAVDDAGNYNSGLQDSGSHNGNCSSSPSGQTYVRSQCKSGFCGYMYVYYMPKDNGVPFPSLGHRHDFEEVVVWTKDGEIIGAAYSAHGDYRYHDNPHMSDGRVNPSYDIDGVTHSMAVINRNDRNKGTVWPAASWDRLTNAAKQALNDTSNFPTSVFPARDDNFINKLNEARLSSVKVTF